MLILYDSVLAYFLLVLALEFAQTSWSLFVVFVLGVGCPFSKLTSVPVRPAWNPSLKAVSQQEVIARVSHSFPAVWAFSDRTWAHH